MSGGSKQILWIPFGLPGLNEIISEARKHRMASAKQKKVYTDMLTVLCKRLRPCLAANFEFIWVCKDKRHNPDNLAVGVKYIFDGLVKAKILKNDGWAEVKQIIHKFKIGARAGVLMSMEDF